MRLPSIAISVDTEEIEVRTLLPQRVPDMSWRYVDKKGHGHFWEGDHLPTLEWVITGTRWVGEGPDASEVSVGEHRCRICEEVIKPKKKEKYGPTHVPGRTTVTLTLAGEKFVLSDRQYAEWIENSREHLRRETGQTNEW